MGMYFKDKSEILKVRVTQEQDEFLMRMSVAWGVSKSAVLRTILNTYINRGNYNENK